MNNWLIPMSNRRSVFRLPLALQRNEKTSIIKNDLTSIMESKILWLQVFKACFDIRKTD